MPTLWIWLIIGGGLVAAVFVVGAWYERQSMRRDRHMQVALDHRLSFDPRPTPPDHPVHFVFDVFKLAPTGRAFNTLEGTVEAAGERHRVRAGDFQYRSDELDDEDRLIAPKTPHPDHLPSFSYVALHLGDRPTADVRVRPTNAADRVAAASGVQDLNFESVAFSDAFHVMAGDERFASDLLTSQMMELLLETRPPALRISGQWLLLQDGHLWPPERVGEALDFAKRFVELWPRHLLAA